MNNSNVSNRETAVNADYYAAYQRPLFSISKGDTAFAVCAVVISVLLAVFGIFGGFALGYLIASVLMFILIFVYTAKKHGTNLFSIVCGALSVAGLSVFITTENGTIQFFAVIICFLSAIFCFDANANGKRRGNRDTVLVIADTIASVGNIDISVKSLFSSNDGGKKTIGKVLIGIVCAIPVLIVVIPLLISSDEAFKGMMSGIFSNTFTTLFKIAFGVAISVFVISYGLSLKNGSKKELNPSEFKGIENIYLISFLSAISACYVLYLFSQLAYFFSAFKGFLPEEFTLADYARKGFFEMCAIAIINLVIVFISFLLAKKLNGKVSVAIKAITTFIASFTLVIITTAISKMALYIDGYGMTVLRIGTSAFMILLAIVFISVILRIYLSKINVVKTTLITAGIIVILLGTLNINAVCAKYNYQSFKSGKLENIDVQAIYELDDEGVPYLTKLACVKDKEVALSAQRYLRDCYWYDYFDNMENAESFTAEQLKQNRKNDGFEHYSIPKQKAYQELYKFIQKNPDFDKMCYNYFITENEAQSGIDYQEFW